ncbi:MAG TPA: glycosyltransferase family 2 protein [Candidatus Microsaccharimonas sp.]|jgi:cellulose synthase/poly-beta-1,6-N-acetylglucosamine synthase-like glycosyltransferase
MNSSTIVDFDEQMDSSMTQATAVLRQFKKVTTKVVALVPAYNEEDIIEQTIDSLMRQTYAFAYVLVIANNCKDRTVEIVKQLQRDTYGYDQLRLVEMDNNPGKKSGALNYGFDLLEDDVDLVFCMDSDTIVDEKMIEMGVYKFGLRSERNTGGICSAYRALPLKKEANKWQRFLWRIQNIEFGLANAWRIENYKSARVLPGVSVMYRMEALRDVQRYRLSKDPNDKTVWATNCLVEDYLLTLELKDIGWGAKSSHEMVSWSDVPLKLNGKGGLFDQRARWYSGTIDVVRPRMLARNSRYEVFTISLLMLNLFMRVLLYGTYAALLISGTHIELLTWFLVLPVIAASTQYYRLMKYADQLDRWQKFFTLTLVVNELYAIYREVLYAYSIWLSFARPNRAW